MTSNENNDKYLDEFIEYAEEVMGYTLTDWQRGVLANIYNRYGDVEVHAYVDKADREYDKVDDELSDLVDEFLTSPAKGEPVSLDLGDLTDKVRTAIEEAGYSVNSPTSLSMSEYMRNMARQLTETIDEEVVASLDDDTLAGLVELVNNEWSSRGHLTPAETEELTAPAHGKDTEADSATRVYAAGHAAYLNALMANGFNRNEAMAMVMFELQAALARDLNDRD